MALSFEITSTPGCAILSLKGRIITDEYLSEIIAQVENGILQGTNNWVYELSQLEYCNSIGLNLLVRTLTKARNAGGDCVLVNLQPGVKKLFELSKLNQIFTAFDSLDEAKARYNTIE